ncbi:MAG: hypothetical protein GF353_11515, partial [Candidatus Lokiarchaeota archaeon]|nr:hypothetical protein [Candidatus Lokiarchaeota archaeon]
MSFNLKTGKELLKYYNKELNYLENLRHKFTIKSYLQILIIAIQIGVFGIIISNLLLSSYFFSNFVNSPLLIVLLIMIIIFGFVIFDSLVFNLKVLAEKIWTRPILYQRFEIEREEDTSKTIESVMNK